MLKGVPSFFQQSRRLCEVNARHRRDVYRQSASLSSIIVLRVSNATRGCASIGDINACYAMEFVKHEMGNLCVTAPSIYLSNRLTHPAQHLKKEHCSQNVDHDAPGAVVHILIVPNVTTTRSYCLLCTVALMSYHNRRVIIWDQSFSFFDDDVLVLSWLASEQGASLYDRYRLLDR